MTTAMFGLSVSHYQILVFDGDLADPFNHWTETHANQGFSWREGSVAFGTVEGGGNHVVEVAVTSDEVDLSPDAVRIIQVPFEVAASGSVVVASILGEKRLNVPPGRYALRFEYVPVKGDLDPRANLIFIRHDDPGFKVLRADDELSVPDELLLSTRPA
jgi:hypothetical protein